MYIHNDKLRRSYAAIAKEYKEFILVVSDKRKLVNPQGKDIQKECAKNNVKDVKALIKKRKADSQYALHFTPYALVSNWNDQSWLIVTLEDKMKRDLIRPMLERGLTNRFFANAFMPVFDSFSE